MIQLSGLSKQYSENSRVLDQVSLALRKGEFLYVVGGSGAGKSTLLRMLATEEAPSAGKLALFGYDLSVVSPNALRAIRRSIGYIPQNIRLISDLTVYDNVAMSVSLAGRRGLAADVRTRIAELLERMGLWAKRDLPASALSGGEAQRVAIARALARQPEVIIADEPTGAQDHDHTWGIMDLFCRANLGGATVVVATHDQDIVRRIRRPCAILKGGRVYLEQGREGVTGLCI